MIQAPEHPTTESLRAQFPLSAEAEQAIAQSRADYSTSLDAQYTHTLGVVGYCARPGLDKLETIIEEGAAVVEASNPTGRLYTAHRGPFWKPRSDPSEWHGEETTDAEGTYLTVRHEAERFANVASEIGFRRHLPRYGHMLSFGWIGSRNVDNTELIVAAAIHDPSLPIGIKNGLDGTIEQALAQVALVNKLRSESENAAPAVLIYRGGENAKRPADWERRYIDALIATEGRMIVDTAHGTEMAFDPEKKFRKSETGQVRALEVIVDLAADNCLLPAGVIMEASNLPSRTDPHMPLDIALDGLMALHKLKFDTSAV